VSNEVEVQGGRVKIGGKEFSLGPYIIEGIIGAGANGVVLKADNPLLGRKEAIKIWLALRASDRRDKIEQGILEAQKQAAEQSSVVVKIYHANVQDGLFYSSMEFFDGIDLKKFLKTSSSLYRRLIVAGSYLHAIDITSKPSRFHGDPHLGNVLLGRGHQIKLCDYGTSNYLGHDVAWNRHWKIVEEVMTRLLREFKTFRPPDLPRAVRNDKVVPHLLAYYPILGGLMHEVSKREPNYFDENRNL
jgi:serine/threonine protein kinase